MSDTDQKYLDAFAGWLRGLGEDAEQLASLLNVPDLPPVASQAVAGGLNYLFKSLDLIPDGIDDIGYLDDAFVLRVANAHALAAGAQRGPFASRLEGECGLVRGFLGDSYARLDKYVTGLRNGAARGRAVSEILASEQMRSEFLSDVKEFAASYSAPPFSRDTKSLVKLRAFFDAKLPR